MKKQWKWLLSALALVALLVIATVLYRSLSDRFAPGTTVPYSSASGETQTADHPAADEPAEPSGDLAADFTVLDRSGKQVRLSEQFGKPLVVNFWASWCGPCCYELPAFDTAAAQYADEIGFMMVNLTDGRSETVDSVQAFLEENGYTFPVYFDTTEEAAQTYSVFSIPLTVFIRADGTVMDSHIGAMDETMLQSYLEQLLA